MEPASVFATVNSRAARTVCGDERLGLVILDAVGHVNGMTEAAFAMAQDGLFSAEQGVLRFAQPEATSWLRTQVACLRQTVHASFGPPLTWQSPERRIELGWWPLRWSERPAGDPEGLLAIRESSGGARPASLAAVCRDFGLTSTETEIVIRIANGQLVKQIAAARRTSVGTVRSHLKTIFLKTGTTRQLHLVQRVLQWSAAGANSVHGSANPFMRRSPTPNLSVVQAKPSIVLAR